MSELAAENCADCGRTFGHPSTYRLVNGRAVCRARKWCQERIARRYAELMRAERKQRGEGGTWVVHVNRDEFDVYIGRAVRFRPDLEPEGWGNPFSGGGEYDLIAAYREWIQTQPQLLARLGELKGKVLGCWCAPAGGIPGNLDGHICHGEVLAALADTLAGEQTGTVRTCRGCGCDDEWGCDNGCYWVETDLCSNCVGAPSLATVEAKP